VRYNEMQNRMNEGIKEFEDLKMKEFGNGKTVDFQTSERSYVCRK
jgi:hypothetical protein